MSAAACIDAVGRAHVTAGAEARIVSLVPSITELLFDLGLGARLVGRTGFCIHPRDAVHKVPKVGGTKDVRLDALRALRPTHVVVNVDENERGTVDEIEAFVPHVIVTHPNAPEDNVSLYRLFGSIFGAEPAAARLAAALQRELVACRNTDWPAERVLYLIWKEPWMTVAANTYIARTLATVGWQVEGRDGGWAGADRYPVVDDIEKAAGRAERVLLSSEPYRFGTRHVAELSARISTPVDLIDGAMTSWYGSRAIGGLAYLRALRSSRCERQPS